MCDHDKQFLMLQQIHDTLAQIERLSLSSANRPPEDVTISISGTQFYAVDYRDFRYLYAFCPQSIIVSAEDIGGIFIPSNTWTDISLQEGMRLFRADSTSSVTLLIRATDRPYTTQANSGPAVGPAYPTYSGNPTQTATSAADTLFKWGINGDRQMQHVAIQNNSGQNFFYAFDQDSTGSTNQVYTLATGNTIFWDRAVTVLHVSTATQVAFGGQTGVTIEGFL